METLQNDIFATCVPPGTFDPFAIEFSCTRVAYLINDGGGGGDGDGDGDDDCMLQEYIEKYTKDPIFNDILCINIYQHRFRLQLGTE